MRLRPEAERWPGGYIRAGKRGKTYVIERWVGGTHFHVSTRCRTLRAAMQQLERFEANPAGYDPRGSTAAPGPAAVALTDALIGDYLDWMRTRPKPATEEWIRSSRYCLGIWRDALAGRDLRTTTTAELAAIVAARRTMRAQLVQVIRSFGSWLRRDVHLLTRATDPTTDLRPEHRQPEKHRRRKVVPPEHVRAILPHLPDYVRDMLLIQCGTAWHVSEVRRFAQGGEIVRVAGGSVLAVLMTKHKSGETTRTPITEREHLEAATRLRERGHLSNVPTIALWMRRACDAAGIPRFKAGAMRHSVLTWAVEAGATPQEASEFAGHKSVATTKRFYLDLAVPTVTVPVKVLG